MCPRPRLPFSIERSSASCWPGFTVAVTRYRTRKLYYYRRRHDETGRARIVTFTREPYNKRCSTTPHEPAQTFHCQPSRGRALAPLVVIAFLSETCLRCT